ncbi:hypothetical protein C8T65DRAFT_666704 [Cerioporus squamosus]|nr:hypothetical protein C8T65DRAFT_666704 [Cerioporus squamosus]
MWLWLTGSYCVYLYWSTSLPKRHQCHGAPPSYTVEAEFPHRYASTFFDDSGVRRFNRGYAARGRRCGTEGSCRPSLRS